MTLPSLSSMPMQIVPPFAFRKPTKVFSKIHLGLESFMGRKQFLNSMNILSRGTVYPYQKQVWQPKQRSLFIKNIIFAMRTHIEQENPYQVKNKRFRRRVEENESVTLLSISRQRRQQYQSPSIKTQNVYENRQQQKVGDELKTQSILSSESQSETKQSCQVKSKQKIRRRSEYDQQLQFKFRAIQQVLKMKQERIKLLQNLLQQKNTQNAALKADIAALQAIKEQKHKNQQKYYQQIHHFQLINSQEIYKLNQKVKKYQIQLACTNKKWKDEFDRITKQKDQEIRSLKQKLSNVLRSNRQKQKMLHFPSQQILPAANFRFQKYKENDSLELSSFQVSK